ncbi:type II CAAX prenyl endopeptidase Rce1 family protein [Chloroflexota bacterium]
MRDIFKLDLKFDREIMVMTIASTLLITIDRYHNFTGYKPYDRVILFLVIPLLIILLWERRSPVEYGIRLGDWKAGLVLGALVVLGTAPFIWLTTRAGSVMEGYYGWLFEPGMLLRGFFELIGWEFFFRGWLLFGYARKFGDHALWLQAVPFALAHLGKPEVETLSTLFGGFLFGLVAWRSRSFFFAFLVHWSIYTLTVLFAGGYFG